MNWSNLQQNKCPACGKELTYSKQVINCSKCKFRIGESRFKEICASMNERKVERMQEKQGFDRFDDFNKAEERFDDAGDF